MEKVKKYLENQGYKVLDISQPWRHIVAKIEKGDHLYFFKLATTPEIAKLTQNESKWNRSVSKAPFIVSPILSEGIFNDLYYFITNFYSGQLLAERHSLDAGRLTDWLDKIVKANMFLMSLPTKDAPKNYSEKFYEKTEQWFAELDETTKKLTRPVVQAVKKLVNVYKPGVSQGDFVPWHMIEQEDTFVLVDNEHGSWHRHFLYDVAYFYHRVATDGANPEIANLYLKKMLENLNLPEFLDQLRPVLASRIIGGFWDIRESQKNIEYHQKLLEDFINNRLV